MQFTENKISYRLRKYNKNCIKDYILCKKIMLPF